MIVKTRPEMQRAHEAVQCKVFKQLMEIKRAEKLTRLVRSVLASRSFSSWWSIRSLCQEISPRLVW